ncbi:MAG: NTPase [Nitrososphaerales archaeon]
MAIFILTGYPGTGKTTAVIRLAEMLKQRGVSVGGIVSRDIRKDYVRIGFEFVDISSNETALLASVEGTGPKVGKYKVDLEGCRFAVNVLRRAIADAEVIACDELGPLEFKSKEFIDLVKHMLALDKHIIVVVHKKLNHPVIEQIREKASFMINLDIQNRNKVPYLLLERLE